MPHFSRDEPTTRRPFTWRVTWRAGGRPEGPGRGRAWLSSEEPMEEKRIDHGPETLYDENHKKKIKDESSVQGNHVPKYPEGGEVARGVGPAARRRWAVHLRICG